MTRPRWFFRPIGVVLLGILLPDLRSEEGLADPAHRLVAGKLNEVPFSSLGRSLPIWIPEEHGQQDERRWPVLLYYHGTSGSPTLRLAQDAAGKDDWILIGMSYRQKGRFSYRPENLQDEIQLYQELLELWNDKFSLRLDPKRVYVGGFSKGGWLSALFLEEDPRLAGAVILGAGHLDRTDFDRASTSLTGKPVFLGLGESDGNVAMSYRAKEVYESAGARVTWELWDGLAHSAPGKTSQSLRQWFRTEGQPTGSLAVESDAIRWLETEWARIESLDTKVEQWIEIEKMKAAPWYRFADQEILADVREWEESWHRDETRAHEVEAKERYFTILEAESKNRYVETLRAAAEEYRKMASEFASTHWGGRAAIAYRRCSNLLP